jgi:hypothetical protein
VDWHHISAFFGNVQKQLYNIADQDNRQAEKNRSKILRKHDTITELGLQQARRAARRKRKQAKQALNEVRPSIQRLNGATMEMEELAKSAKRQVHN